MNSKKETDEWIGVSKQEQQEIVAGISELNNGQSISRQRVMTKLRDKYKNA